MNKAVTAYVDLRHWNWKWAATLGYVFLLGVVAFTLWLFSQQQKEDQVELCRLSNETRQIVSTGFETFGEVLIAASAEGRKGEPVDPKLDAQIKSFRDHIEKDILVPLGAKDCVP